MATLTRSLAILVFLMLGSQATLAAVVSDPWLARLQVGEMRKLDDVRLDDAGWPEDILEPLVVDPAWLEGAASACQRAVLSRAHDHVAWRLALPSLGSSVAAQRFFERARASARAVRLLAARDADPLDSDDLAPGPWRAETLMLQASRSWQQGYWQHAASVCRELLRDHEQNGMSAVEFFAWTLREELLRERAGHARRTAAEWAALAELGPYDVRSGWTLWVAMRRHDGRALAPPDASGQAIGALISRAGKLWLTAAELRGLHFPSEVEAGMGAILLPVSDLPRHFQRYDDLPTDGRFQGYWLRGQRRLRGTGAAVAALASRPGLKDGHRLDLWRRASERRLLDGEWTEGLVDLEAALLLLDSEASGGMQKRLLAWVEQALSLALAKGRTGDADRIIALAEKHFDDARFADFVRNAASLLARRGGGSDDCPTTAMSVRSRAESIVRAGQSPDIGRLGKLTLPDADEWRDGLWDAWVEWGLKLLESKQGDEPTCATGYAEGLRAVRSASTIEQRHTTACAVAAAQLATAPQRRGLLEFALQRDVERASGGRATPRPTPLVRLIEERPGRDLDSRLRGHALLGAAIALGDERGQLAIAVRLPAAGVADAVRWRFWYPVPEDPAVRRALAASDLPPELLLAIARNESLFEPAIRSRSGALGYMQIMPFHYDNPASGMGAEHWSHPATSLEAAARVLRAEIRNFDSDPYRTVAAYNAGRGAVKRWQGQLDDVPDRDLFWAWIGYPETRGYTLRVLRDRYVYRELLTTRP